MEVRNKKGNEHDVIKMINTDLSRDLILIDSCENQEQEF